MELIDSGEIPYRLILTAFNLDSEAIRINAAVVVSTIARMSGEALEIFLYSKPAWIMARMSFARR